MLPQFVIITAIISNVILVHTAGHLGEITLHSLYVGVFIIGYPLRDSNGNQDTMRDRC